MITKQVAAIKSLRFSLCVLVTRCGLSTAENPNSSDKRCIVVQRIPTTEIFILTTVWNFHVGKLRAGA